MVDHLTMNNRLVTTTTVALLNMALTWAMFENKEFSQIVGNCLTQVWNDFAPPSIPEGLVAEHLSRYEFGNISTLLEEKIANPLKDEQVLKKDVDCLLEQYAKGSFKDNLTGIAYRKNSTGHYVLVNDTDLTKEFFNADNSLKISPFVNVVTANCACVSVRIVNNLTNISCDEVANLSYKLEKQIHNFKRVWFYFRRAGYSLQQFKHLFEFIIAVFYCGIKLDQIFPNLATYRDNGYLNPANKMVAGSLQNLIQET